MCRFVVVAKSTALREAPQEEENFAPQKHALDKEAGKKSRLTPATQRQKSEVPKFRPRKHDEININETPDDID